jgi:hypothetical protein
VNEGRCVCVGSNAKENRALMTLRLMKAHCTGRKRRLTRVKTGLASGRRVC